MSGFPQPVILSFVTTIAMSGIAVWQPTRARHSQAVCGETPGVMAGPDHAEPPNS